MWGLLLLSLTGSIFLPIVGLLIQTQSKYIHGFHNDSKSAGMNCCLAGGCYIILFIILSFYLRYQSSVPVKSTQIHKSEVNFDLLMSLAMEQEENASNDDYHRRESNEKKHLNVK